MTAARALGAIHDEYMREWAGYRQLVGSLYPSIVYARLMALRQEYVEAGGRLDDLPPAPCPGPDGRAPR